MYWYFFVAKNPWFILEIGYSIQETKDYNGSRLVRMYNSNSLLILVYGIEVSTISLLSMRYYVRSDRSLVI
jgi:hypothetical protein